MIHWLLLLATLLLLSYIADALLTYLNMRNSAEALPEEFKGIYSEDKYQKARLYHKETSIFSLIKTTYSTCLTLVFLLMGGFHFVDTFARSFGLGQIITGCLYFAILGIISWLFTLPFDLYSTFKIEDKYSI